MYPTWLLCWANIRKNKINNGFILLILVLSTVLLSTAVLVMNHAGNVYQDLHQRVNGSHEILKLEKGLYDPDEIRAWWGKQEHVTASDVMTYRQLAGISYKGEDNSNVSLYMMRMPSQPLTLDRLVFAEGAETDQPAAGTVWIPTSLAESNGIKLGDDLEFITDNGRLSYQVSAVVIDIAYCSPFSTTARIWMNEADYDGQLASLPGEDRSMISLRYADVEQSQSYWDRFQQEWQSPFLETVVTYDSLSSYYLITSKIISAVMISLAVIMMIVALFTIGFTISDAVLSNFKSIGIVRSLGMTAAKTEQVYVIQYLLLAVVSIVPGILLSYLFSDIIISGLMSYLASANPGLGAEAILTFLLVGLGIVVLTTLAAKLFAAKARRIEPVQAMRFGMSEKDNSALLKRRWFRLDQWPVSLGIGIRSAMKNLRGSILMSVISMFTSAVLVFGFLFLFSILSIQSTIAQWGYDSSDVSMRIDNKQQLSYQTFKDTVLTDDRIANYSRFGDLTAVVPTTGEAQRMMLTVVDGNYDQIGYVNLEGRNPQNGSEISLGVNMARSLDKKVGDSLTAYIEGKPVELRVTGIYQSIANMANTGRIMADAVWQVKPTYSDMEYTFVNLKDGVSPDTFVNSMKEQHGTALWAGTQETLVDDVFSQAVTLLVIPLSVIGLLFLLATYLIVYSICRVQIKKESKTYGIYKSIGMTSGQIRMSISKGIIALSLVGAIIGIAVGLYAMPPLLDSVLGTYGIVHVPLVINWVGILLLAPVSVLAAFLGSWIASRVVDKTSPRILVIE